MWRRILRGVHLMKACKYRVGRPEGSHFLCAYVSEATNGKHVVTRTVCQRCMERQSRGVPAEVAQSGAVVNVMVAKRVRDAYGIRQRTFEGVTDNDGRPATRPSSSRSDPAAGQKRVAGVRQVDDATYRMRMGICMRCKWLKEYRIGNNKKYRCKECGCVLNLKARLAAWECRIGKWRRLSQPQGWREIALLRLSKALEETRAWTLNTLSAIKAATTSKVAGITSSKTRR